MNAALLAALLATPPATGVEVHWGAPEACPDAGIVEHEIERYLGQPLDAPREQWVAASADVIQDQSSWVMELSIETRSGTALTRVAAPGCDALADLAALKIAMAIDPLAVLGHVQALEEDRQEEPQRPAPEPTPPAAVPEDEAAPVEPEKRPTKISGSLRAEGLVGWGVLPGWGAGTGFLAALHIDRWRVGVGGRFWFPREYTFARFRMLSGHIRGCGVPRHARLEFPLCVGVETGSVHGQGVGLDENRSARRPWIGLTASPGISWAPTRRFALWIETQAAIAVRRPAFAINDGEHFVHRASAAAFRGAAGVELRFP